MKALDRIAETVPNAKFILVICDPIERAFSDYNHKVRKSASFRRFLSDNKIENFDDFVMRHSPRLRILKEKKMTTLLENDLYNSTWNNGHLSILTGKLPRAILVLQLFSWFLLVLPAQIY